VGGPALKCQIGQQDWRHCAGLEKEEKHANQRPVCGGGRGGKWGTGTLFLTQKNATGGDHAYEKKKGPAPKKTASYKRLEKAYAGDSGEGEGEGVNLRGGNLYIFMDIGEGERDKKLVPWGGFACVLSKRNKLKEKKTRKQDLSETRIRGKEPMPGWKMQLGESLVFVQGSKEKRQSGTGGTKSAQNISGGKGEFVQDPKVAPG